MGNTCGISKVGVNCVLQKFTSLILNIDDLLGKQIKYILKPSKHHQLCVIWYNFKSSKITIFVRISIYRFHLLYRGVSVTPYQNLLLMQQKHIRGQIFGREWH